ncbi:MAG: hypothetical protein V3T22_01750 [Planctomycetota bacterium]
MAAEPNHPRATLGRQDTQRLLSVGEAADLAQVSHMTLRSTVRAGRMTTVTGRRRGRLLRLLRVEELARVYPEVLDRLLPPAVPVEEIPALPVALPVALHGTPLADQGSDPHAPDPARAGAPQGDSAAYLWTQLDQLREQVRAARGHNRRLFDELSQSDSELRELRDGHVRDERTLCEAEVRVALGRQGVDAALAGQRRAQRLAAVALGAALLTAGISSFLLARQGNTVWAGEPTPDLPTESTAELTGPLQTVALPPGFLDAEPALEPALDAALDAGLDAGPIRVGAPITTAVPAVFRGPVMAVEDPSDASPLEMLSARSAPPATTLAPVEPPERDGTLERACTFHARVRAGSALRGLLGPCSGDWSPTLSAVVGRVRSGGRAYCRQHHVIASTLDGSIERARAEAEFSLAQGLLPPLLAMRIDNAAAAFLRARIPAWIESGFEAGPAAGHGVTGLEAADAWRVESWVRYRNSGGEDLRRTFRVELVLGDGAAGDVLRSFDWTDG